MCEVSDEHGSQTIAGVFDLRLVVTLFEPFTNSHYGEDNMDEAEQRDVKYGFCDNGN